MSISDLIRDGFANVRRAQERLECWPDSVVSVNGQPYYMGAHDMGSSNELRCTLPEDLLRRILNRKVHWNSAELACLIKFRRFGPYLPDVHVLLSFFSLPPESK